MTVIPPAAPKPPKIVEYPVFDPKAFAAFMESAPYGRDVKPLLNLLAGTLAEPERRIAMGLLMRSMPHIVLDSQQAGSRSRYSLSELSQAQGATAAPRSRIALHDGPVLVEQRKMFGDDRVVFFPDDPAVYVSLGAKAPDLKALPRESASEKEAAGSWGRVRVYADGSERMSRSQEQLAGTLLHALMELDARARDWEGGLYSELRAAAAEFRFYRLWEKASGGKPQLDRDLEASYAEWLERPEDYFDSRLTAWDADWDKASADLLAGEGLRQARPADDDKQRPVSAPPADPDAMQAWLGEERLAREAP